MSPNSTYEGVYNARVPRASGDEPTSPLYAYTRAECSPRERG